MKYREKHCKLPWERWSEFIKKIEPFLRLLEIVVMLYSAIAISGYANQLTKVQVEIARADIQPDFSIQEIAYSIGGNEEEGSTVAVQVENLGGRCKNVSVKVLCGIDFSYCVDHDTKFTPFEKVRIWVPQFFSSSMKTGANEGLILTTFSKNNQKEYYEADKELLWGNSYTDVGLLQRNTYVWIQYDDILNEHYDCYFQVNSTSQRSLSVKDGKTIFDDYFEQYDDYFEEKKNENARVLIDELTAENICKTAGLEKRS